MKSIDVHAHVVPRSLWDAVEARKEWYGFCHEPGEGLGSVVGERQAHGLYFAQGALHAGRAAEGHGRAGHGRAGALDPHAVLRLPPRRGARAARWRATSTRRSPGRYDSIPKRFSGLATLPMQDVKSAIDELEHAVTKLGLKGASSTPT